MPSDNSTQSGTTANVTVAANAQALPSHATPPRAPTTRDIDTSVPPPETPSKAVSQDIDICDMIAAFGAITASNSSLVFEALQVSVRSALPTSSISSETLSTTVGSLHTSHLTAYKASLAEISTRLCNTVFYSGMIDLSTTQSDGTFTQPTSLPPNVKNSRILQQIFHQPIQKLSSTTLTPSRSSTPRKLIQHTQDTEDVERSLDAKLAELRIRLRNATAAEIALTKATSDAKDCVDSLNDIQNIVKHTSHAPNLKICLDDMQNTITEINQIVHHDPHAVPLIAAVRNTITRDRHAPETTSTKRTIAAETDRPTAIDTSLLSDITAAIAKPVAKR